MLTSSVGLTPAILISSLALLFTVASFWWINLRRGHLRLVGIPRSFALSTSGGNLTLTVPLSLYNSGPTPVWAINLFLRFDQPGLPNVVPFVATRPAVNPRPDDDRPWASQIVLAGHESVVVCCEFIQRDAKSPVILSAGDLSATVYVLEARTWGPPKSRTLGNVMLRLTDEIVSLQGAYLAHDNFWPLAENPGEMRRHGTVDPP